MSKLLKTVVCLLGLLPAAALGVVLPAAQTLFEPDGESVKHPRESILVVPVPVRLPGSVKACVEYGSTVKPSKGKIRVKVETRRDEKVLNTVSFGGKVGSVPLVSSELYRTKFLGCKKLKSSLAADDVVVFVLRYRGFPQMDGEDSFVLTAAVVPAG